MLSVEQLVPSGIGFCFWLGKVSAPVAVTDGLKIFEVLDQCLGYGRKGCQVTVVEEVDANEFLGQWNQV